VWSRDEPHRIGESAPVEAKRVVGRGGSLPGSTAPRLVFYRQRPGASIPMPPLESPRISRVQLELSPGEGGALAVRSVGRSVLLLNGEEATSGLVRPGDIVTLRNALVVLVTQRRALFPQPRSGADAPAFPFGEADAHGIVGESPAAWALREKLAFAARTGAHVLLQGESGVGKELAARAIHALSDRSGGPFVARNAATFPEGLIDAELFGAAKGYPNAGTPERAGLIGEANGGTLLLDEIGELPQHLQAHLLRVLDRDGQYQRLGETRGRRSDLRLIAATNRSIDTLKHDFAARLTMRVDLPGLGARREDVPLLLRALLVRAARTSPLTVERYFEARGGSLAAPRIDPGLLEALLRHRFTHHLRELERLMWVAIATSPKNYLALTNELRHELRVAAATERAPPDETGALRVVSAGEIEAALGEAVGNVTDAARRLGLKNRFALYRLMKRHGILTGASDEPQDEE
jgi:DNA-binding NtrC family response regulator